MQRWRVAAIGALLLAVATVLEAAPGLEGEGFACEHLERARSSARLPGLTAAVGVPDGSIVEFALGRSAGDSTPIEPDAKFLSGSIGKTYVAAVAMDLQARGILNLDAPLKILLGSEPWFRRLPNWCCVTLRQLLNHSSGWPSHVDVPAFQNAISQRVRSCADCLFTAPEAIKFIAGMKALFPPGQGFAYSETNYLVAGLAIEKVTGRTYYELLWERILVPLGLTQTVPSDRNLIPGLVSGRIQPHANYFRLDAAATMKAGMLLYNPGLEWTGGGLAASSSDLVRWGRALYTGHALAEPYLHDLFTSVITQQGHGRYGLGVDIKGRGAQVAYGHTGSIPGYRATMHYFPASGVTVAVQFNADPDNDDTLLSDLETAALAAAGAIRLPSAAAFTGIRCSSAET